VIVPLVKNVLQALRDVRGFLRTAAAHSISRDIYIRFLARVSVNNCSEAISAYWLRFQGRAEMRSKEDGYSTHTPDVQQETGLADDSINI
jgi:hypothetical protein